MATPMMITKLENGIKRTGFVLHFYFFPCFVRVFCFPACGPLALHIISCASPDDALPASECLRASTLCECSIASEQGRPVIPIGASYVGHNHDAAGCGARTLWRLARIERSMRPPPLHALSIPANRRTRVAVSGSLGSSAACAPTSTAALARRRRCTRKERVRGGRQR